MEWVEGSRLVATKDDQTDLELVEMGISATLLPLGACLKGLSRV